MSGLYLTYHPDDSDSQVSSHHTEGAGVTHTNVQKSYKLKDANGVVRGTVDIARSHTSDNKNSIATYVFTLDNVNGKEEKYSVTTSDSLAHDNKHHVTSNGTRTLTLNHSEGGKTSQKVDFTTESSDGQPGHRTLRFY